VSKGKLVCLSTPYGRRGWFHSAWADEAGWHKTSIPATQCPRISADFLEEERQAIGEHFYAQEYELEFRDVVDAFFRQSDIDKMADPGIKPLFLE